MTSALLDFSKPHVLRNSREFHQSSRFARCERRSASRLTCWSS